LVTAPELPGVCQAAPGDWPRTRSVWSGWLSDGTLGSEVVDCDGLAGAAVWLDACGSSGL
jgi:hypothetical protein